MLHRNYKMLASTMQFSSNHQTRPHTPHLKPTPPGNTGRHRQPFTEGPTRPETTSNPPGTIHTVNSNQGESLFPQDPTACHDPHPTPHRTLPPHHPRRRTPETARVLSTPDQPA
jgi:hypothetical protein